MEPGGSLPHSQDPATCPYSEAAQSSQWPHPTSLRSILILSCNLRLGLPSGRLPSGHPSNILYAHIFPHTCYMPRPSHSSRFDYPNNIWWWVQVTIRDNTQNNTHHTKWHTTLKQNSTQNYENNKGHTLHTINTITIQIQLQYKCKYNTIQCLYMVSIRFVTCCWQFSHTWK
jgi:hypothetical protein